MGISYDLCTHATRQGARGFRGAFLAPDKHPCVFSIFCVAPANFTPPHPLGPLPVLNSMASWPKGSIFSLVSPVQPLDRITHIYSYTKTLTIGLTCIYTCNLCRIIRNTQRTQLYQTYQTFLKNETFIFHHHTVALLHTQKMISNRLWGFPGKAELKLRNSWKSVLNA